MRLADTWYIFVNEDFFHGLHRCRRVQCFSQKCHPGLVISIDHDEDILYLSMDPEEVFGFSDSLIISMT